jgi:hypothetical protein
MPTPQEFAQDDSKISPFPWRFAMLMVNDAQTLIVESLLTKMLIHDAYSVAQLEEAISWFQ